MTLRESLPAGSALLLALTLCGCGDNLSPDGLDISGLVWNDSNGDGIFDADEEPIAGSIVFLDENDNRVPDGDEQRALTNTIGVFRFENLRPGIYQVRQALGFGWRTSSGTGMAHLLVPRGEEASPPAPLHIIGGSDAQDMAYPFMASLGGSSGSFRPFCGGALISDRFVLTAAHCSEDTEPEQVSVMLATNDPAEDGLRVGVRSISIHPDWEGSTESGHDMALWELEERLDLAALGLRTVDMLSPANRRLAQTGALATTIGWGVSDNPSPLLQEVHVPIVSEDQCADGYPEVRDFETQICAGSTRGGLDSCQGDSGGPLLVRDTESKRWMHAGITSWGEGCALPGKPGIYGRTSTMSDWARSQVVESSATYLVDLKGHDVELEFPDQATTRPLIGELAPRWSMSSMELKGVTDGTIAANAGFQVRFFLFADPDFDAQEFTCLLDMDGPGELEADEFSCKSGTNSIGVNGYPDGIFLPELRVTSSGRSQTRRQLVRSGEPASTEFTGTLSATDSEDADYPSSTYYIDYFAIDEAYAGKVVLVELESSFSGQLGLYDADVRDASGGGTLQINSGGSKSSLFFVPEAGRNYLIGVSSAGMQATGSYTLRLLD